MLSMNRWSKLKNLVRGFVLSAFLLANLMNSTIAAAMAAIPKNGRNDVDGRRHPVRAN